MNNRVNSWETRFSDSGQRIMMHNWEFRYSLVGIKDLQFLQLFFDVTVKKAAAS